MVAKAVSAPILTSVILALVAPAVLAWQGQDLASSELPMLRATSAADQVDTTRWATFRSDQSGFAIKYPHGFVPQVPGDELVLPGAVVTFVPTFDPSIDESGSRTNLYEVSVTVGVVSADYHAQGEAPCPIGEGGLRLNGGEDIAGKTFSRYCFSEAGAGNVYEEVGYRTTSGSICYEIVLFLHYGNPACYPEGTVVVFDPMGPLCVLDAMVSTFLTFPRDESGSG
jgi:hypothetical protein